MTSTKQRIQPLISMAHSWENHKLVLQVTNAEMRRSGDQAMIHSQWNGNRSEMGWTAYNGNRSEMGWTAYNGNRSEMG